jgi:hypothetical protein
VIRAAARRRRDSRRAHLVHHQSNGARPTITPGCWVVVGAVGYEIPLALALVAAGPEFVHEDDHAIDEIWTLHDGTRRHRADLTVLDIADVLEEGTDLLGDIRGGRYQPRSDDVGLLRVHRAACLALKVTALDALGPEARALLDAVVNLDAAIADAEIAWRDLIRVRIPNLLNSLRIAGALELAREPGWTPNTAGISHPGWPGSRDEQGGIS